MSDYYFLPNHPINNEIPYLLLFGIQRMNCTQIINNSSQEGGELIILSGLIRAFCILMSVPFHSRCGMELINYNNRFIIFNNSKEFTTLNRTIDLIILRIPGHYAAISTQLLNNLCIIFLYRMRMVWPHQVSLNRDMTCNCLKFWTLKNLLLLWAKYSTNNEVLPC